ncbi:phage tail tape measure protein [Mycobacterium sp. SMC-2]|uniref:phage tail tape measure protein n=1 Tax=Mycobacterium sp. SMC-2 TaxID=2857058 RepID=UPI0021B3AAE2|nr:phage tail tape measure protein [Mycobacterium sp. SMC-2]
MEATAREITAVFNRLGADISKGLGGSLGKAFGAFDTGAAREELSRLENAWRRAADVERDQAARMERDARRAAEAVAKYGDDSSRALAAQANAARSQRDYVDALAANEAAQRAHTKAVQDGAAAAGLAGRAWNAAGIGGLAVFTGAVVSSTEAAGNFQQGLEKLHTVAGESTRNFKLISDGVLNLASQVGYSANDLMNAMFLVEKAGLRGPDAIKVLTAGAQLASQEGADLDHTINGLTTTMRDYHIPVEQAADITSKLNVAIGLSKVSAQDFTGALHNVEPTAAGAGESINDLYASLAMLTQSGMGADQATQNLTHTITSLSRPTKQMRDEMAALGIDSRDIQAHFGDRGLVGTANVLYQAVQSKLGPSGKVMLDTWFKSQQVSDSANQMMAAMPPNVRAVAEAIDNGTLSYKEFRKTRGGLGAEQANEIEQWKKLEDQLNGFNQSLKSGQGDWQTQIQALALLVGGQDNLRTVLQLVGENGPKAADAVNQVAGATADADGKTKGFTESQTTYNAKMKDFKGALSAVRVEIGNDFLPAMTQVVGVLGDSARYLTEHKTLLDAVVGGVGALGGAWLGFKAIDIAGSILRPIASGLGTILSEEEGAETATAGLSRALSGLKAAGVLGIGAQLGGQWAQDHTDQGSFLHSAAVVGTDAGTGAAAGAAIGSIIPGVGTGIGAGVGALIGGGVGIYNQVAGHAGGGPLRAPGPKGHDSALFWGAEGEHVFTADDVDAMGGHGAVYAFRNALHRQYGGAVGRDVQVAESMAGTSYSQRGRTDCSGMVGRVVLGAMGLPATNLPTTQNMGQWLAALGFQPGIGGPGSISVGWYNHGSAPDDGHAAMTLSDGENAESGGSHGNFLIGSGAAGASSSEFDHHMFLPNLYGQGTATGMPGFGGGFGGGMGGGFGGGSIPPGATPGTGPGGQPGYYTANPERVASAQESLRHLNDEIHDAEERKQNLKADASQDERDRLDHEIQHLYRERDLAQERVAKAEQGTFHAGRHGRGGSGNPFLPVPLADKFGLSKGLPGLAEWLVGFAEDMVLGPLETAAWSAMGGAPGGMGVGAAGFGPSGLGYPNVPPGTFGPGGDANAPDLGGPPRGNEIGPATGGGSAGTAGGSDQSAPVDLNGPLTADQIAQLSPAQQAQLMRSAFAHPAPPAPNFYKQWYPAHPHTDADSLPPDVRAWAQQHGMIGPDGNYSGPSLPSLGPKSVAPPVKMQPDLSKLGGNSKGPQPYTQHPPWTDATRDQRWWHDPHAPSWDTGLNVPKLGGQLKQFFDPNQPGFASGGLSDSFPGGPKGTDTIPAWLSPGEMVMNSSATSQFLPQLRAMNAQYFAPGTGSPLDPTEPTPPASTPQNMLNTPGAPGAPKPGGPPGAPKPGQPAGPKPSGGGAVDIHQGISDLASPGADAQQPGTGQPAQPGIGFSGGAIGALESAASSAGSMFPGGSAAGAAMQVGFQELNRAAAAGAQDVGIGVEGILEALIPDAGGSSGDWSKTIPGRLLMGMTGVRPAASQNTAGQTQQPFKSNVSDDKFANPGNGNTQQGSPIQILGPVNVQADNTHQLHSELNQQTSMAANTVGASRP